MKKPIFPVLDRRTAIAGAGASGVMVVAGTLLPEARDASPAKSAEARTEPQGGYRLTDHIKQYYASARH